MVVDRDHMYELNGEDSRALAVVGAFRVVPERELGSDRDDARDGDTLDHLCDEGLIRTIALDEHDQAVVLTDEGRDLLDANRRGRDEGESQAFYAGVNRPRELDHDAHLGVAYAMKTKIVYRTQGSEVADAVAKSEAELGITFTSELQPNKGVKVAGTLPAAIQLPTIYAAAVTTTAGSGDAARAFLRALAGAEGRAALTKAGLEPLAPAR